MSEILVFSASLELYNSFMLLLSYFPKLVFLKTGILKTFCHKIFTNMLLSWMFWHSFRLAFGLFVSPHA